MRKVCIEEIEESAIGARVRAKFILAKSAKTGRTRRHRDAIEESETSDHSREKAITAKMERIRLGDPWWKRRRRDARDMRLVLIPRRDPAQRETI